MSFTSGGRTTGRFKVNKHVLTCKQTVIDWSECDQWFQPDGALQTKPSLSEHDDVRGTNSCLKYDAGVKSTHWRTKINQWRGVQWPASYHPWNKSSRFSWEQIRADLLCMLTHLWCCELFPDWTCFVWTEKAGIGHHVITGAVSHVFPYSRVSAMEMIRLYATAEAK